MRDKPVQKERDFFQFMLTWSYITLCSKQQQGARRRRNLNNPECFCPSRAKAHCPDGNENIFKMKRTFSPSPGLNFWWGFSSALSWHRSGLARHPRLSFLLDVLSAHFFFPFFFVEDEERRQLHNWSRRWPSLPWSNVSQLQRGWARWALRILWFTKNKLKKKPTKNTPHGEPTTSLRISQQHLWQIATCSQ